MILVDLKLHAEIMCVVAQRNAKRPNTKLPDEHKNCYTTHQDHGTAQKQEITT
jgi:hypothetical protein